MGENLDIQGRLSVRTPMQWSPEPNGGFSTADRRRLARPLPDGDYGPDRVNVLDQRRESDSLLNWMERIMRRRRETPEFGWGSWATLDTSSPAVLAHRCDWEGGSVMAVHNFSSETREVAIPTADIDPPEETLNLEDLLVDRPGPRLDVDEVRFSLEGYGHRWFRIRSSRPGIG